MEDNNQEVKTKDRSKLNEILDVAIEKKATDIHLSPSRPPVFRINSQLMPWQEKEPLTAADTKELAFSILDEKQKEDFLEQLDIDLSFSYNDKARFRVNAYHQIDGVSIALRLLPTKIMTIDELHLPEIVHKIAKASQGFFLVVGPSGHGKSTALAALINEINQIRKDHIVTIEDPIEYVFKEDKCIIDQREVGDDALSFKRGLKAAFRQDPDVMMIGEMRDPETISSAVTAAETGHLALTTLHTNTAAQTVDRIIDSFPPYQQPQIRVQLASNLLGILSRRLIPSLKGGVINAVEIMLANSAIRSLIRDRKVHQINMVIETSSKEGMITLNKSLANLVRDGWVSVDQAELYSPNVAELRTLLLR